MRGEGKVGVESNSKYRELFSRWKRELFTFEGYGRMSDTLIRLRNEKSDGYF